MPSKRIKKPKLPKRDGRILDPKPITSASSNHLHPAFCFKHVQKEYSIDDCNKEAQAFMALKIQKLSQLSWAEIRKSDRHAVGHEIITRESLRVPLPPNTPGDREFLVFRLGGRKDSVFIGYRQDKIFYIVWVDPNGQTYNHG